MFTIDPFAMTYLVSEGIQAWRIGSVHHHRPSRALLWLSSLEAISSHGLQDIREKQ